MAGRMGSIITNVEEDQIVYSCPNNGIATIIVSFCNRNTLPVKVNLAITDDTDLPEPKDYLWCEKSIVAHGSAEKIGIVLGQYQNIIVRSDSSNVAVNVYGWEEVA